jgi:hypothetical protein
MESKYNCSSSIPDRLSDIRRDKLRPPQNEIGNASRDSSIGCDEQYWFCRALHQGGDHSDLRACGKVAIEINYNREGVDNVWIRGRRFQVQSRQSEAAHDR